MKLLPLTTKGGAIVGTAASIVTVPAFLILRMCGFEWLPTATLPNLIDLGRSLSLPPACGVWVGDAVGVAVAVEVAVAVAVAVMVMVAVTVGVDVGVGDAVGVAVGVGVASIAS